MSTISKFQGSAIGLAFAFAALCSAAVVVGTPLLFPEAADQATFLVFWSVLFTFSGVLTGVNLEVTRSVSAAGASGTPAVGPRVLVVAAVIGLVISALLAASARWWAPAQFPSQALALALAVALGVALCGGYHGTGGSLAGASRWTQYAALISADSMLRLVLVVLLAIVTGSVVSVAVGAAVAFGVWLFVPLCSAKGRAAMATRADVPLRTLLGRLAASALATGASAMLVIGFPALLSLTTPAPIIEAAAPLLMALTLTRAPLMIPLNAAQGVVISHFSANRSAGLKALWPICRVALLVGGIALLGAWLLGPWLLTAIWGESFWLSGGLLAALTAGATGLALITLTGAVAQSLTLHRPFVAGWLAAVAVALVVLYLPLSLEVRAPLALGIGPLVGIAIHLAALRKAGGEHDDATAA